MLFSTSRRHAATTIATVDSTTPIIKLPMSDPGALMPIRLIQLRGKLVGVQQEERFAVASLTGTPDSGSSVSRYEARARLQSYDLLQNPIQDFDLNLASSLQMTLLATILHLPMAVILRRTLDCLHVVKVVWRVPDFVTKNDTKWLCQKPRAVLHELLSFVGAKAFDTSDVEGQLSETARLTLIIVMTSVQYRIARLARRNYGAPLNTALTPLVDSDRNTLPSLMYQQLRGQGQRTTVREEATEAPDWT